jgi:hypothetical protein
MAFVHVRGLRLLPLCPYCLRLRFRHGWGLFA